jgi:hypothetical protein
MTSATIVFWISLSVLFFCYLGYGILLFLLNGFRRIVLPTDKKIVLNEKLQVTLIVTACDEEQVLEQKNKKYAGYQLPGG